MVWSGPLGNGLDPMYRAALAGAHTVYQRVDVTDYLGNLLVSDLWITSGSVTATLTNRVARRFTFTTTREYMPVLASGGVDTTAVLNPFGNRVKAYRGIQYGDGQLVYFPVFYGRIDSAVLNQTGIVTVNASDLAAEVVDGQFESPVSSVTTLTINEQFRALVSPAVAGATFGTSDTFYSYVPALTWQSDRAKALDDLAGGVGGIWYPLADGSFVIRLLPWTLSGLSAVASLSDGTGGLILQFSVRVDRNGVDNSIVYTSERLDGSAPVTVTVRDDTATSATYWKGPYGLKPRLVQNQASLSYAQAYSAATTLLRSSRALVVNLESVTVVPDPSLELGDVIQCSTDGISTLQVVTGFTLPMFAADSMPITLRQYTPS